MNVDPLREQNRVTTVKILDRAIANDAQLSFEQRDDVAVGDHWHARLRWTNRRGLIDQVHALSPDLDEALRHLAITAMAAPDRGHLFGLRPGEEPIL